jgi:signal peptidase I
MRRVVVLTATVVVALGVLAWATVAPPALGGPSGFAVIVGTSMEPALETGDLAVVHKASAYRVGDVVLYRSTLMQRHVLHRIVAVRDGRFVLRGDANAFDDPERPAASEIVGRRWFTIPLAGALATWLRMPLHAAVVVFLAATIALLPGAPRKRPRPVA